jgi:hypothetical protein
MVHRGLAAALFLASAAGAGGCSSGSSRGTEPICNTVVDDAPTIVPTATTDAVPTPTGGTITPGTYELVSVTLYVGPDGTADAPAGGLSRVFEITENTIQQAGRVNDVENHATTTFTISGTTLSTVDTCPAAPSEALEFSATETDFRIYATRSRGTFEQVYTRRSN